MSSSRDLPNSRTEAVSPACPAMADRFFTTEPPVKPTWFDTLFIFLLLLLWNEIQKCIAKSDVKLLEFYGFWSYIQVFKAF